VLDLAAGVPEVKEPPAPSAEDMAVIDTADAALATLGL